MRSNENKVRPSTGGSKYVKPTNKSNFTHGFPGLGRIVITGGPCSGKTTLIKGLARCGFYVVPEAARIVHRLFEDARTEEPRDVYIRQRSVLQLQTIFESDVPGGITAFLDRGIPDGIAYFRIANLKVPPILMRRAKSRRYYEVFFLDPVPYRKDAVREEDERKASLLTKLTWQSYEECGYTPVRILPLLPTERIRFILSHLSADLTKIKEFPS